MVASVDAATVDKVVAVVVADAVVATLYPVVDVVEDPCTVEYPSKKIRVTWHIVCFTTQHVSMAITIHKGI